MPATTVLTQSLYQGTVYSTPLPWQAGATMATAAGLLSDQDGGDATKTLTMGLEASFDGGLSFSASGKTNWQGGQLPHGATSGPPWQLPALGVGFSSSQQVPSHVRVRLELPATLSVGATLSFS